MDGVQIEQLLGKPEQSPEVQALLKHFGVTKKLKLNSEGYVSLGLEPHGLQFSFKPEAEKSSKLIFSVVFFYTEVEGFKLFAGTLPFGLKFTDTKVETRSKLGTPATILERYRRDNFIKGDRYLVCAYSPDGPLKSLTVGLNRDQQSG